ncbi:hypothetical protein QQS21_003072 [Conoideocrella luteorostrata]|uniref:Uncharacterized protein n=1 Tax=Conoideocrella luteorostrata TaxID=1105319 RepID=A0AAJ0CU19_9HYPO|nr:hypothetical protein QQS21_003072 [Conoideocrella luteorostrata]
MSIQSQIHESVSKKDELLKTLSETDHASSALNEQDKWVDELEMLLRDSDKEVKYNNGIRESNLKEHTKYRDSHVRRFMYKATGNKDKFAEKASKGEEEYFNSLQKAQQEDQRNSTLRQQLAEANTARDELRSLTELHDRSQKELDHVFSRIFSGQTADFPEEDEHEQCCDRVLMTYRDCRGKFEAETTAMASLAAAERLVLQSRQHIDSALSYSRWDMFGGGKLADAMERNELAKCDHASMQAQLQVSKAQRASPFVQDLPGVNINHGHIFSDIFFDNIFTDMRFHDEIKRAASELERCHVAVQDEWRKSQERRATLGTELSQREAELDNARRELQRVRGEIFEKVMNGQKGDKAEAEALKV